MTDHPTRDQARDRARAMGYRRDDPPPADGDQEPDLVPLPDVSPRVLYQLLVRDQLTPEQAARARRMFAYASRAARQQPGDDA